MKFHSLMAVVFLLLAVDSGAALLPPAPLEVPAHALETSTRVYQNGDLVLEIRDTAGGEILRAGLGYFFNDEHIATVNELPDEAVEPVRAQASAALPDGGAQMAGEELPEPWSLGLLGAGIALLGWTRRQESWMDSLRRAVFPWPGLSWLD